MLLISHRTSTKGEDSMKTLLLFMILLMPVIVYAEPCPDIEYAKLKDMSHESIEKEYCNAIKIMKSSLKDWTMSSDDKITKEVKSCNKITDEIEKVYKERFKENIPNCLKD